jgi:TfoX/Sxy family transcriptional regulator of competence genes
MYSESLAERVRHHLRGRKDIVDKRMFGGLCFLLDGKMLVGVWKHSLIARVGEDVAKKALKQKHVREFDVTGKPMRHWVLVEPDGVDSDQQLAGWIDSAEAFVETLPAK